MAALKGATLACARTSIPFDSYSIILLSFYRREPGCCLSMPVVIGRKGITELCAFSWTITRRRSCPSVHEKRRHRQTISSSGFSNLVESAPNAVKVQRSSTLRSRQTRVHRHRRQRQRPSGQGESRTYKEPLLPQPACYRGSQLSAPSKFQCSHIMSFASIPVSMAVRRYNDQGLACGWDYAHSAVMLQITALIIQVRNQGRYPSKNMGREVAGRAAGALIRPILSKSYQLRYNMNGQVI